MTAPGTWTARGWTARGTALAMALVLALVGCGVPDSSRPRPVGKAPGFGGQVELPDVKLPEPGGGADPRTLVERFLMASAAGDWDPDRREERAAVAAEQARRFLTPEAGRNWQPTGPIVLVDIDSVVSGVHYVTVRMRPVGVLGAYGAVEPITGGIDTSALAEYTFDIERSASGDLRLTRAPPSLLLSTDGLQLLYDVRPIYFWDRRGERVLVPDRRYLAKGVSREKRIREVVERLLAGPSTFLEPAVTALPANTTRDGIPVVENSRIVVNLTATVPLGDKERLRRLASQLRWSLHPETLTMPVELQIAGRSQGAFVDTDYRLDNPAQPADSAAPIENDRLFAVVEGKVRPVRPVAPPTRAPAVLDAPENSNVVLAAVSRQRDSAALVRAVDNRRELWIGRYQGEAAGTRFVPVANLPSVDSRPAYLPGAGNRVLVAAAGDLFDVGEDGMARAVDRSGLAGHGSAVTAVAVAPDGARVAFVAGDRVWVATMDTVVTPARLSTVRLIDTPGLSGLVGVAWEFEHQLVVAGGTAIAEVAIDNGFYQTITPANLGTLQIRQLASVPRQALNMQLRGPIVIQAGQQSWYVFSSTGLEELRLPLEQSASPSPSGSPTGQSTGPPFRPPPLAPFFLDVT